MTYALKPVQLRALQWLKPGDWHEPSPAVATGLGSLARHRPDLVERKVLVTERGYVAEYRLTQEGEQLRAGFTTPES